MMSEVRKLLYCSHFISEFSEQAWQFAVVMFLAAIQNFESLILVSGYGLTVGLVVVVLGPMAGRACVDDSSWNRLRVLQTLIACQNTAVILASTSCYILLVEESQRNNTVLLTTLFVFGSLAGVLSRTVSVILERDWIVVMASCDGTNPDQALSELNVGMRQIDLTCRIVAPAATGFLIGPTELWLAVLIVASLNVLSLVVEMICSVAIYRRVPALAAPRERAHDAGEETMTLLGTNTSSATSNDCMPDNKCWIPRNLQVYMKQRPVAYAGLALALLYLNVLTFGALMTAYLLSRGMRLETVGIWRGVSSASGLLGTWVYTTGGGGGGATTHGLWSIWYLLLAVSVSFGAVVTGSSPLFLMGGVVASRIGLWVFDIAVTQLMQQNIPEWYRGTVGGTQAALNSMFTLVSFGVGLIWPDPDDFAWLVAAGYVALIAAAVVYTVGLFWQRHRLVAGEE